MKIGVENEYKNCSFDYLCNRIKDQNASKFRSGAIFLT